MSSETEAEAEQNLAAENERGPDLLVKGPLSEPVTETDLTFGTSLPH
jgi:hypothetical protein